MAKVGFSMGLTLHLGAAANNEYVRVGCDISDIDTSLPLDEQLAAIRTTAQATMREAEKVMDDKLQEMIGKKIFTP